MNLKAKKRMALVNKKNMKRLKGYFDREGCSGFDLSWAVNYLVDIALGELEAIRGHMTCEGCEYAVLCNNGEVIYYCDHEGRTDDMGKLSMENLVAESPEWCPLREEIQIGEWYKKGRVKVEKINREDIYWKEN